MGISDTWSHKVSMISGEIHVDNFFKAVKLRPEEVQVGCTVVSREVIEYLAQMFAKHFPAVSEVTLQR